ncbi:MAG: hypothetical protein ACK5X3_02815 [Pseudomonadota bacterium]|jgi:hypothetical protein
MAKTVQEQLDAALARVEKLRAKLNAVTILANVDVGNRVEFTFGRAEKKRTLSGVVIAVGEDAKAGKLAAIQSGEGMDVTTYKVRFADITTNFDAPEGEVSDDAGIEADPLSEA